MAVSLAMDISPMTRDRHASGGSADPFQKALLPPRNETAAEKLYRTQEEIEAKKRSDLIDAYIKEENSRRKKERANERTILLLGQANAGKTTILKQMRMLYAADRQALMRRAWMDVIYLNVILAIKLLLEALEAIEATEMERSRSVIQQSTAGQLTRVNSLSCFSLSSRAPSVQTDYTCATALTHQAQKETSKVLLARLRLAPFLSIESDLRKKVGAFEDQSTLQEANRIEYMDQYADSSFHSNRCTIGQSNQLGSENLRKHQHVADLRLRAGWQEDLVGTPTSSFEMESRSQAGSTGSNLSVWRRQYTGITSSLRRRKSLKRAGLEMMMEEQLCHDAEDHIRKRDDGRCTVFHKENDPSRLLSACVDELSNLWNGPFSAKVKARLCGADSAAYFLSNAARIASSNYTPVDDDILHARVRTIGATEEHFVIDKGLSYRMVDVGGSKSQRNVWAQFFHDATAIIFLAPISAFDEYLEESPDVNRVVDSLEIWRQVIVNPLLYNVSLILFLNKMDLFRHKLGSGIRIKEYFIDYQGNNDYETGGRFFKSCFHKIVSEHRHTAPTRSLYVHKTTATSTKEIQVILLSTKDAILRHHLKESGFA